MYRCGDLCIGSVHVVEDEPAVPDLIEFVARRSFID